MALTSPILKYSLSGITGLDDFSFCMITHTEEKSTP